MHISLLVVNVRLKILVIYLFQVRFSWKNTHAPAWKTFIFSSIIQLSLHIYILLIHVFIRKNHFNTKFYSYFSLHENNYVYQILHLFSLYENYLFDLILSFILDQNNRPSLLTINISIVQRIFSMQADITIQKMNTKPQCA